MRLRFLLLGLFFVVTFLGTASHVALRLSSSPFLSPDDHGFDVSQEVGILVVGRVLADGPAADALRAGDEILSLNGRNIRYRYQLIEEFRRLQPGGPYSLVVRRDAELHQLTLRSGNRTVYYFVQRVLFVLGVAVFFLTGLIVFLLRPYDKRAVLLALWFATFGAGFYEEWYGLVPRWLVGVLVVSSILRWFLIPLCLHFFLVFPEQSPLLRRFPRLEFYLYLPYLLVFLPYTVILNTLWASSPDRAVAFNHEHSLFFPVVLILGLMYFSGGLLALLVNYRQASIFSQRKMRIVLAGTIAGFLPAFIWGTGALLFAYDIGQIRQYRWPYTVLRSALFLVPLSFAYAILRHKVIPVSIIIRRGVQYLLAKNVLRILIALPILGLIATVVSNPDRTLSDIVFRSSLYFYLTLISAATISFFFRKRLNEWIDRKFFREQYNQEKILRELIEDLKRLDSIPEMSRLVSQKVQSALHPDRIYLFYREGENGSLSLGYSAAETSEELRIPEEFHLLRLMEGHPIAQEFPLPQKINLPDVEKEWLARLGARLIVPLLGGTHDRLAGLFLLGEKKSEVPYTARDRGLLEALAGQIALVYENAQLKERVDQERKIKREILGRFEERHINLLKECPKCGGCFDSSALSCDKDGSELTFSVPAERTIEDRYRLERLIGKGGMGAVYEATDLRLNRKDAVKILSSSMFGNHEALVRFEREARTSARLGHPNIVSVYDYGVLSNGGAYLVMELISGETLRNVINRKGCVDPQMAAELFEQVLEGVKAAHQAGVIHRDLKPDNILISPGEGGQIRVYLLDFGLAKIRLPELTDPNSTTALATAPGRVMGTFGYMSPEQLTGALVDERSDLFAIGVMVVEVLTGRRPFHGKTYQELLMSILHDTFHLTIDCPEDKRMDAVLQKCLAKDPEERFSSASKMQRMLIPAIREYSSADRQECRISEAEDTRPYQRN